MLLTHVSLPLSAIVSTIFVSVSVALCITMVHREQALLAGLVGYVVDNLYVSSGPHNQVTNLPLFLRAFIDKPKREKNNDNDNRKEKRREDRVELN